MSDPVLGFAGMTHLGLVSGVCAAEKGFQTVCLSWNWNNNDRIFCETDILVLNEVHLLHIHDSRDDEKLRNKKLKYNKTLAH